MEEINLHLLELIAKTHSDWSKMLSRIVYGLAAGYVRIWSNQSHKSVFFIRSGQTRFTCAVFVVHSHCVCVFFLLSLKITLAELLCCAKWKIFGATHAHNFWIIFHNLFHSIIARSQIAISKWIFNVRWCHAKENAKLCSRKMITFCDQCCLALCEHGQQ